MMVNTKPTMQTMPLMDRLLFHVTQRNRIANPGRFSDQGLPQ
jgi:hypothetical protein